MSQVKKALTILKKFNKKLDLNWKMIESLVQNSINTDQPLILIQFTCSTINPKYLYDPKRPQLYVSLNPKGNNLINDLPILNNLFSQLSKVIAVKLIILIGNTDPFYIYSEGGSLYPEISNEKLLRLYNQRWNRYKTNLERSIRKAYPDLSCEIISWYQLESNLLARYGWDFESQFNIVLKKITDLFPSSAFQWELAALKKQFGSGKYFYNLAQPSDKTLKRWIKRKLTEYALQGLWIKTLFANVILLQNEKPSDLRTSMYQPLINDLLNCDLQVIYPYGVDNLGYQ